MVCTTSGLLVETLSRRDGVRTMVAVGISPLDRQPKTIVNNLFPKGVPVSLDQFKLCI